MPPNPRTFSGTSDTAYRTPIPPAPVELFDVTHPALPAGLDGVTILHISDLHVRRSLLATERYRIILHALQHTPADLICLTGDLMDEPGHERAAMETLRAMSEHWRPRIGVFCVFGNHDTPEFRRMCRAELPNVNCIGGTTLDLALGGAALRLIGLDWPEDPLGVQLNAPAKVQGLETFELAVAHHPTSLVGCAELGIPIMLAGHTHAGQVRLHAKLAPHTSSDMPPDRATGILRLRDTLCCISRGVGDGMVEGLRINCPRQMPLYTLRRNEMPGDHTPTEARKIRQVVAW